MAPIPDSVATPLAGGELVAGMTLVLTAQILWSHGVSFNIFHDMRRQTLLNGVMFLAAINGILAYPLNATGFSVWASNITTLLSFSFVQYGLVMINHNSFSRWNAWSQTFSKRTLNVICGILYILPLFVMIPIYFAAIDKIPSGTLLNTSEWNKLIFKPMTLALIVTTEVLATISDVALLAGVFKIKNQLLQGSKSEKRSRNIDAVSLDLIVNYLITWFLLFADILLKILIIYGYPLLFDSIVSIATIAMRARSNILFGLNMKDIFESSKNNATSQVSSSKSPNYGTASGQRNDVW